MPIIPSCVCVNICSLIYCTSLVTAVFLISELIPIFQLVNKKTGINCCSCSYSKIMLQNITSRCLFFFFNYGVVSVFQCVLPSHTKNNATYSPLQTDVTLSETLKVVKKLKATEPKDYQHIFTDSHNPVIHCAHVSAVK